MPIVSSQPLPRNNWAIDVTIFLGRAIVGKRGVATSSIVNLYLGPNVPGRGPMQYSQTVSATSAIRNRDVAHETTDEALVASIAKGDKRALQTLYGRHNVRVYRFALRFLNDEALAEDMVSEVFFDVWRQAERFEA